MDDKAFSDLTATRPLGVPVPGGAEYHEWRPRNLAPWVELLWHFRGPAAERRRRVLPNGRLELMVNLGEPYVRLAGSSGLERMTGAWLGGLANRPMIVGQTARLEVLGLRLRPLGAFKLLGLPLDELTEIQVDLQDLVGNAAQTLESVCHGRQDPVLRLRAAALWASRRLLGDASETTDPLEAKALGWASQAIEGSRGGVRLEALRQATGWSKSRWLGAFRRQIGLTPKRYATLVRFRHVLETLQNQEPRLAELALDLGYFDQAHLNRDFRRFAGLTPSEFVAARHGVGDGTTCFERSADGAMDSNAVDGRAMDDCDPTKLFSKTAASLDP